jgi:hypothetical protein
MPKCLSEGCNNEADKGRLYCKKCMDVGGELFNEMLFGEGK